MMGSLAAWSLRFRLLVLGAAAAMVIFGASQLPNVAVDVVPEFSPPYVEIQTEALGLSAEEVEQLITVPLEADLLNGVAWLDSIESESVPGLSSIVLNFEPGTDVIRARQIVAERLTQAHALPNVSKPPTMLQPLSSANRVLMVSLTSQDVPLIDMSVLAWWTVRPRLMGVPGVANVAIWGQRERQLQVLVDPERLRDRDVSLLEVIETAGNALWVSPLTFLEASTPGTGGFIETPNQRLGVQHISPISSAEDLAQVALESENSILPGGGTLLLGDVATVVEGHQPLIGDAVVGGGEGLLLVVERFPEANTLEVTRDIEEALTSLKAGLGGIEIDSTVYRPGNFVEAATGNLALALLTSLVLVAVVLGLLLVEWRAAVISLVAVPLSLAAAALVLYLMGMTINVIVIAGLALALGIIVDDAVVTVDSISRRLRKPRAEDADKSTATLVLDATLASRGAAVYATLILALAAAPLLFLPGPTGAFMPPLIGAYALAILASMAITLTVSVTLATTLLPRRPQSRGELPVARRLTAAYQAALSLVIKRRGRSVLAAGAGTLAVLALVLVGAMPQLGSSVVPSFQERDLLVRWDGAPGTSHTEMRRMVEQAGGELRLIPGVRNVGAHVGRALISDRVVSIDSGEIWVSIDGSADYDTTVAAIRGVVEAYPGVAHDVETYTSARISEVLAPGQSDVVVRIYGQDGDVLRAKAAEVQEALSGVPGLADLAIEPQVDQPSLQIKVDLAAARLHGIKAGDVRRSAATLLSGITVGSLFEQQKVFEVVVWGVPEVRQDLTSIRNLLIDTPAGEHVRLGDVADVEIASTPSVIRREGVARRIDITGAVVGRDLNEVIGEVESQLAAVSFPLEYHAEVLGDSRERQAALGTLAAVALAAAIGIILLLQAAFGSWRLAGVAFLALPVGLVGGAVAGLLGGELVSLGSLVGLVTVLGIATRNGVTLISHFQQIRAETGEPLTAALVLRGARERMGPILITAVATALALAPFVVLGDLPGYEVVRPMAIVILGGLVSSTLLNLFIIPVLYLGTGPRLEPEVVALEIEAPTAERQAMGARS